MKITLTLEGGGTVKCRLPYEGAAFVIVPNTECPHQCGDPAPVAVQGRNPVEGHDTVESVAFTTCCNKIAGVLRVRVKTLFGIEEDRAVLSGRWRVY